MKADGDKIEMMSGGARAERNILKGLNNFKFQARIKTVLVGVVFSMFRKRHHKSTCLNIYKQGFP